MSTTTRACPKCGDPDGIEVGIAHDTQGEGAWSGPVTWLEIVDTYCGCELTEEQENRVLDAVDPMDLVRDDL